MKRKIALLLAVVMILSLVPMMSFAASDNRVSRVGQIEKDASFTTTNAPTLRIEEKDNDFGTDTQSIRLRLEGAEWLDGVETVTAGVYDVDKTTGLNPLTITKIKKNSDTSLTLEFNGTGTAEEYLEIALLAKVKEDEAKVIIDARDSNLTGGSYVFARSTDGKAIVSIADSVTFGDETKAIKTIEIDETSAGSYGGGKVSLKLPGGFEWDDTDLKVEYTGRFESTSNYTGYSNKDGELKFNFDNLVIDAASSTRGTIYLEGLKIKADSDAKYGDVNVRVTGTDIDSNSILVAKYKDFGVTVAADDDPTEIIAGKLDSDKIDEIHELQKLIIKEDITGSWLERTTSIEFPSWVKVREVIVNKADKMTAPTKADDLGDFKVNKNRNIVEFTPRINANQKANLELTFYVSVEANASGDITAQVSSRGLDQDYEVVLGKAVAPIEVDVEVADLRIGVQSQELGKITLSENVAGAFMKDGTVVVELEDDFRWRTEPTIEVVEGEDDLKIDRVKVEKNLLTFRVTRASDEPAVIEITDAKVDLYRTLPEGEFRVFVGGSALVENFEDDNYKSSYGPNEEELFLSSFETEWVADPVVAKVITPAPGGVTANGVSLTIGVVPEGGDVAPYINNNRTYAPVSAVAQALGVAKSNIIWNEANRTVTVFGDKTVQMTIGSTTLLVNGTPVVMDAAPEITNNRTFLPIAWLAKALDVQYAWDAATQTVTFN